MLVACPQTPSSTTPSANQAKFFGVATLQVDSQAKTSKLHFEPVGTRGRNTRFVNESSLGVGSAIFNTVDKVPTSERFLNASFSVTNNGALTLNNLTFIAYHKTGNANGSAFSNVQDFSGGTINADNLVLALKPTNAMKTSGASVVVDNDKADLQVFTTSEASALDTAASSAGLLQAGEFTLEYGYVTRHCTSNCATTPTWDRSLPPAATGNLTIALRVPQTGDAGAGSGYRYTMQFLVFEDANSRVTQSLDEQNDNTQASSRATSLAASTVNTLAGSTFTGINRFVCSVRTAGSSGTPLAYLTKPIGSISLSTTSVSIGKTNTRGLVATVKDSSNLTFGVPGNALTWNSSVSGVATVSTSGVVTGVAAGSSAISVSLCGVTSSSATINVVGATTEVEPNNTNAQADASVFPIITSDANIAGAITPVADLDRYKLLVAADSTIRFELFADATEDCRAAQVPAPTKITLLDSVGVVLNTDTTSGIENCSAIVRRLTAGTYYVQVSKNTAGTIAAYMLQVRFLTDQATEVEPNNTQATATALTGLDAFILGGHQVSSDTDWYALIVPAGASLRIETIEGSTAETCESLGIDSKITLFNAVGTSLGVDDDTGRGFCSQIDGTGAIPLHAYAHNLAAGTYYIAVEKSNFASAGSNGALFDYRLALTIR